MFHYCQIDGELPPLFFNSNIYLKMHDELIFVWDCKLIKFMFTV